MKLCLFLHSALTTVVCVALVLFMMGNPLAMQLPWQAKKLSELAVYNKAGDTLGFYQVVVVCGDDGKNCQLYMKYNEDGQTKLEPIILEPEPTHTDIMAAPQNTSTFEPSIGTNVHYKERQGRIHITNNLVFISVHLRYESKEEQPAVVSGLPFPSATDARLSVFTSVGLDKHHLSGRIEDTTIVLYDSATNEPATIKPGDGAIDVSGWYFVR